MRRFPGAAGAGVQVHIAEPDFAKHRVRPFHPLLELAVVEAARVNALARARRTAAVVGAIWIGAHRDPTVADVADRADQPVPGGGGIPYAEGIRFAIPHRVVGTGPAVAGAEVAAVLHIDLVAVDRDEVKQATDRPFMVRPGVVIRCVRRAMHEGIRPRHLGTKDKIMPPLARVVVHEKGTFAIPQVKGIAAGPGDLRDGVEALGVRHCQPLHIITQNIHRRVAEMLRGDVAHPHILRSHDVDESPCVILIRAVRVVRDSIDILNARLLDTAPGAAVDFPAAILRLEGLRQWRIHGDPVPIDVRDGAIEAESLRTLRPRLGELIHVDVRDPVGRAWASHDDRVADGISRCAAHLKRPRTCRNELLREVARRAGNVAGAAGTTHRNERVAPGIRRPQPRAGGGVISRALQHHAAGIDGEGPGELILTRIEIDHPAPAIRIRRLCGYGIDRRLDARPVIAIGGADIDPAALRDECRDIGQGHGATAIAAMGEIRDALPALVELVEQIPRRRGIDPRAIRSLRGCLKKAKRAHKHENGEMATHTVQEFHSPYSLFSFCRTVIPKRPTSVSSVNVSRVRDSMVCSSPRSISWRTAWVPVPRACGRPDST